MPRAAASRELLAAREDVWAFIAEPHHFPDWWPGIGGVQPDRRGLAEGARWAVTGIERPTLLRRPASSGMLLVTGVDIPERFAWTLTGDHIDVELRLEEQGSNRTIATLRGRGALALRLEPRPTTESADSSTRLVPDWCRALTSSSPPYVRFPLPRRVPCRGFLRDRHRHPGRRRACLTRTRQHRAKAARGGPPARRESGRGTQGHGRFHAARRDR